MRGADWDSRAKQIFCKEARRAVVRERTFRRKLSCTGFSKWLGVGMGPSGTGTTWLSQRTWVMTWGKLQILFYLKQGFFGSYYLSWRYQEGYALDKGWLSRCKFKSTQHNEEIAYKCWSWQSYPTAETLCGEMLSHTHTHIHTQTHTSGSVAGVYSMGLSAKHSLAYWRFFLLWLTLSHSFTICMLIYIWCT